MKNLIISALLGCFCLTADFSHAQTGGPIRVSAITNYAIDSLGWYASDSNYFYYSGSRDGYPIVVDGSLQYKGKFDTLCQLAKGARNKHYHQSGRTTTTFDGHNNALTYLQQNYDTATGNWNNASRDISTYDARNNMLSYLIQKWDNSSRIWYGQTRFGNTYDANNDLVTDTTASWIGGTWQYTTLFLYIYDMHHNLTDEIVMSYSAGNWHNTGKYSYFLNAGDKWDSVVSNSTKHIYTYDGAYNELTDTGYLWNSITGWQKNSCISNTYGIHNNQTSQLIQSWDGSGNTIAYNSFNADNMLDTMTLSAWKSGGIEKPFSRVVYYYGPATDVKNVNPAMGDMRLYPSPANSYMNVDIKWKTAQAARLAIYDMNGRLCRQWTADASLNYHSNIPTASLPAGNYILKVSGEAGQVAQQFSVVH